MSLQVITSDMGGAAVQVPLGDGDQLFVSRGVTVTSTNSAPISGAGDNETVNIQGSVLGELGAVKLGTSSTNSGQTLFVGREGLLRSYGSTSTAAYLHGSGSVLENRGTIKGAHNGVLLTSDDPAATSIVRNYGLILAESNAVSRGATSLDTIEFYNSGEVRSFGSHAFYSGFVQARDVIVNAGLMIGNILMGDGDNSYDGSGGRVIGRVFGGADVDVMTGGASTDSFAGLDGDDLLSGGGGNDTLDGGGDADSLDGGDGNDALDGESGADKMDGGAGNDTLTVDDLGDKVIDTGGGVDVVFSSVTFNLSNAAQAVGTIETLMLDGIADINGTGNALANGIQGSFGVNFIHGMAGNDAVVGNDGDDRLWGDAGNDSVSGGTGTDTLYGGLGNDKLTGGALADKFVFDTKPNNALNRDLITDFQHGVDKIQLSHGVFTGIGGGGGLNPAFFFQGAAAHDANDHIIYNKATGVLSYDNDGTGAHAAIQFAALSNKPVVTASDFAVI